MWCMNADVRWIQRLDNFSRALAQLRYGVELCQERKLSILEEQGIIQAFEYNHELAWSLLKDYLAEYGGLVNLIGSRDTTREVFKRGLIDDGEQWMEMIKSRNLSSHTYNEGTAKGLLKIIPEYFIEFEKLIAKFTALKEKQS